MTYRYGNRTFASLTDLLDFVHLPLPQEEVTLGSVYDGRKGRTVLELCDPAFSPGRHQRSDRSLSHQ
jgi:hypothetical protein